MEIFGLSITRAPKTKALAPVVENRGGWFPIIRDWYAGAWQNNDVPVDTNQVLSFPPCFAAITLIASDIAKLRVKLVQKGSGDIWVETTNPAYSPVLRHPNPFQNRIQFWENWMLSKLLRGNTFVLKFRDNRGVVTRLYILDPNRVQAMVADDGSVFYQLQADNIAGLEGPVFVPAREIIHDRMNCMFHPLIGVSPLFAAGLPATQGLSILTNSTRFFTNRSMPGGILTAPGAIGDDTAARLKEAWQTNYSGENYAKVAVLGDGLKFEPIMMTSVDAQLAEQLKLSAEAVCTAFHVPPYKIGVGPAPTYNNIQALNIEYYQQALQSLIEAAELALDEGLGIGEEFGIGTEFDIENLLRMDAFTQADVVVKLAGAGLMKLDEGRAKFNLPPMVGGNSAYLQQQNYSVEALAKRDAQDDPFGKSVTPNPDANRAPPAPSAGKELSDARAVSRAFGSALYARSKQFAAAA